MVPGTGRDIAGARSPLSAGKSDVPQVAWHLERRPDTNLITAGDVDGAWHREGHRTAGIRT